MNLKGLCDLHTHTDISYDGKDAPEKIVKRAKEINLPVLCITDHVECNFWHERSYYQKQGMKTNDFDDFDYRSRFEISLETIPKLKAQTDGLKLLFGCEMGQATQAKDIAKKISECESLDFIIGSLHQVKNRDDFYFLNLVEMPQEQLDNLIFDYYLELYTLACQGGFDVLGHITYPLRYIIGKAKREVKLEPCEELIAETFKKLIQDGRGIEINTSGLRQSYGKTFPDLDLVRLYKDLSGEILTLGSDSHCCADLGKGIAQGAEIAKAAEFKYFTYFEKRKPKFVPLT